MEFKCPYGATGHILKLGWFKRGGSSVGTRPPGPHINCYGAHPIKVKYYSDTQSRMFSNGMWNYLLWFHES